MTTFSSTSEDEMKQMNMQMLVRKRLDATTPRQGIGLGVAGTTQLTRCEPQRPKMPVEVVAAR